MANKVLRAKKNELLVNRQENIIVLNSNVIEKEEYISLKGVLERYKIIHESDLERDELIDNHTKEYIRIGFREIFRIARTEWKAVDKYEYGDTNCALCNQPNKLIFYIENLLNGNTLNVGSSCIEYFKGIKNEISDEPLEKTRNRLRKEQNLIEKRMAFSKEYPDCQEKIDEIKHIAEEAPLLLPKSMYDELIRHATDIAVFQSQFKAGKIPMEKLGDLHPIISRATSLISDLVNPWLKKSMDNPFVITLKDKKWLESQNRSALVDSLRENGSLLTLEAVSHLGHEDFVRRHIQKIQLALPLLKDISIGSNRVNTRLHHPNFSQISLYSTYSALLKNFGALIIEQQNEEIHSIPLEKYVSAFELSPSESNIYDFIFTLDSLFSNYSFYYAYRTEQITIVSNTRNAYKEYDSPVRLFQFIRQYMIDSKKIALAELNFFSLIKWTPLTKQYKTDFLNKLIEAKKQIRI